MKEKVSKKVTFTHYYIYNTCLSLQLSRFLGHQTGNLLYETGYIYTLTFICTHIYIYLYSGISFNKCSPKEGGKLNFSLFPCLL